MKKNFHSFITFSVIVMLIAVMALSLFSCAKNETGDNKNDTDTQSNVVDVDDESKSEESVDESKPDEKKEISLTIEVTNKAGEKTETTIKTTAENLGDALVEAGIAEGTTDQYGLFITTVNGEIADYSADSSYWALYKDGEYLMTGASSTPIADGEHYELVYESYAG